jgi:hypothetical protein
LQEREVLRVRSRRCFDELFNYEVTAKKALDVVDHVAHEARQR